MIKPKKALENLSPYEVDYYKKNWRLKLDANENIYGCPTCVISAIKNFSQEDISLYPTYGELIDKLSQKLEVETKNVLISNGCDEALNIIINSYLDKDDEILSYNPTFSMPLLYAKCNDAKIKTIDYKEKFVFDKEQIKENISQNTKIVYIATPNNPTGEVARASVIELLIKEFENVLFIVDCTYINFSTTSVLQDYIDLTKRYDNIIVVKSFSKDFAIAGLRFGISIANEEIINNLKKVASPYNVNVIALNCAQLLINDTKTLEETKEANAQAREFLFEELSRIGFKPYKSEGNFILCDFGPYSDFYYKKLKNNGVITRKFKKNSVLKSYLRITVPTIGAIKYIIELLGKKDALAFDLEGVIVDSSNSSIEAILKSFQQLTQQEISKEEIFEIKNLGNLDCDWSALLYLLKRHGFEFEHDTIIKTFQEIYEKEYLSNSQELLISKEILEKLSENHDLIISTSRLKKEAKYILKQNDIDNYFCYIHAKDDDINKNFIQTETKEIFEILNNCPYKSIKFFGDNVDDIIAGNKAQIETIGVIAPNYDYNSMVNNFRHLGAKYILGDIKNIQNFIKELKEENVETN